MQHDWPYPLWLAHRGGGTLAPENTLAAFREGARWGYHGFECDVKLSADEQPFLLHDATLARTTADTGIAGQRAWGELARIDAGSWLSRRFAGEPIASLDAVARYVLANHFALNIEIKPTPGSEHRTGVVVGEAVLRLWQGQPQSALPLFSSFRPEALQGARESAVDVPRALLVDTLWDGWFEVAQALACRAVVSNQKLMDAALLARLRTAGLRALCYTVNEKAEAQRLLALGVDGLITDALDLFSPVAPTPA